MAKPKAKADMIDGMGTSAGVNKNQARAAKDAILPAKK